MLSFQGGAAWITISLFWLAAVIPAAASVPPQTPLDMHQVSRVEKPDPGISLITALLPHCELQADKAEFQEGETVLASWAIANPSPLRVAVEFRVHLKAPGNAPVPRTSSVASGRPIPPPQSLEAGSGQLPILTVEQSTTRGLYEMSCRVVDSSTGHASRRRSPPISGPVDGQSSSSSSGGAAFFSRIRSSTSAGDPLPRRSRNCVR